MAKLNLTVQAARFRDDLTIKEACEVAHLSDKTLMRAIHAGNLHADKPGSPWGKGWRIKASDLRNWLALDRKRSQPDTSMITCTIGPAPEDA